MYILLLFLNLLYKKIFFGDQKVIDRHLQNLFSYRSVRLNIDILSTAVAPTIKKLDVIWEPRLVTRIAHKRANSPSNVFGVAARSSLLINLRLLKIYFVSKSFLSTLNNPLKRRRILFCIIYRFVLKVCQNLIKAENNAMLASFH